MLVLLEIFFSKTSNKHAPLRIHPTKSKHMFVRSNYNIKNKVCNLPILINNVPVPRVSSQKCLGVILDEKLPGKIISK